MSDGMPDFDHSEESEAPNPKPASNMLRVIPIGGLGEFGMNMMLYEFDESIIVIDCGMMFPDAAMLGVDVVIPDMTYVFERADRVAAIFLTHGHEDHIGALPFLTEKVHAPVYAAPLTLGFLKGKLSEFGMSEHVELHTLEPRHAVRAGLFEVEAIHVTHSIVDSFAFAIRTPIGTVIHTGDFKFDPTPIDRQPTDLARLAHYGEEGVLALVSDSTNAMVRGFTPSETSVASAFDRIFATAPGRIIVTTFASQIHRIQQIVNQARAHRRKIHFIGRSVVDNVEIAEKLGHLRIPRDVRPDPGASADDDAMRTVVVTTGTQGEPNSSLARMALNEHKAVQLREGDTVVLSARTIPGNERAVIHVIDHLVRRGCDVMHDDVPGIHVSGHAAEEELKLMMNLTKPRFFVPMHGTLLHMTRHARLAEEVGIPKRNIFVATNGDIIEIGENAASVLEERAPAGKVFIDQQFEEVSGVVVRDRQHLAEDGFVIVVAAMNLNTGKLVRELEIITRGVVYVDESAEMLAEMKEQLLALFEEESREQLSDAEIIQEKMRATLKRFFRKKLNRRPMILPVVWEM